MKVVNKMTIDIKSKGDYPANVLSNFYPNSFVFDGVECASMEGFLQSLKTKNVPLQQRVCGCSGKEAKFFFRHKFQNIKWKLTGKLYWKGKAIGRFSDEYQRLLDSAYDAMYGNEIFREALLNTNGADLTHEIGKNDMRKTILTVYEFVSRLERCRSRASTENVRL